MTAEGSTGQRVTLSVPALRDAPVQSGCCAVGCDDLLLDELDSWPGLLVLEVDLDAATAVVLVAPGCPDLPGALVALADRGLPASILASQSGSTPTP